MKNSLKIIIGITILFLLIGVVSAYTNDEFKAPSSLHKVGSNGFEDGQSHSINVFEYTADSHDVWFVNDTNYIVTPYDGDENFYLYVQQPNDAGIFEVVEKDGKQYLVNSHSEKGSSETPTVLQNLLEFNKLNNLKPISIED